MQSINKYQSNIAHKTRQGYSLARDISETVEPEKFQKQQMYEIFIQKMDAVYKSELRYKKKQTKKLSQQRNATLYSLAPLKEILKTYNEMTARGFDSELVTETLKSVDNALRARGYRPRVMNDYSMGELEQSWRMQKLMDDVIFGLRNDQFFSPIHLAQTSNILGQIGYKNTDILPLFFEKLTSLLDERYNGIRDYKPLEFNTAVYGGPKNFLPRHYIFKGFQNSDEFNSYLGILLEWQSKTTTKPDKTQGELDKDALELQEALKETIEAAVQVKELQKDLQSTIESVRTQYFMMLEAKDKHAFIQDNEYIKYDLLELQEMLVKGGYLEPEEAMVHLSKEPFEEKMERAAQVFYDYVLNYAPEMLSPQHDSFYQAAVKSLQDNTEKQPPINQYLDESHNTIDLGTLSQTLVGLQTQALSYGRDVVKNDYLNPFYERFVMPMDKEHQNRQFGDKFRAETVLMERCYLKSWSIFREQTQHLLPYLRDLVKEDSGKIDGQLYALNALAACRFDEPQLRKEIVQNCLRLIDEKSPITRHAVKGGLMGLASSSTQDEQSKQLAKVLAMKVDYNDYTFTEQVDLLWSLCALEQYDNKSIHKIVKSFNRLSFERLDHDLKYEEFTKFLDIIHALKLEAPAHLQITNKSILAGFIGQELYTNIRFPESQATYDPFKRRVVAALAKGLSQASISHENIMENELLNQQTADYEVLNKDKYPYKPDVVMGYKNQKIGLFVLPETDSTRDTYQPTGALRFRMRLLEKAQLGDMKTASVAVPQVISYDIAGLKVAINTEFNFQKELDAQVQVDKNTQLHDFTQLSEFAHRLVSQAINFTTALPLDRDVQKMDAFVKKLYQIFQIKQQAELRFDASQRNIAKDEIRFQLMLANLMHDSLSKECKQFLQKYLPDNHQSFKSLLLETANTIKREDDKNEQKLIPEELDSNWLGTRLEVELPQVAESMNQVQKSIVPEMINQRFMWIQDYFHYRDWQLKQQNVFDNFNLLQIPIHKDAPKYFFDQDHHHRRIPQGVFPFPNHKREILKPQAQAFALELSRSKQNDDLVLFEKEPFKMMVVNEFKKSETLKPIDQDVSMITNLQNIKQGLKADYSDREILNTILLNLNFTDPLIEEHLGLKKNENSEQAKYLNRDASEYRKFVESTYNSKDREDPFTHFYLKESVVKETLMSEVQQSKDKLLLDDVHSDDPFYLEQEQKSRDKLWDKIDRVLLDMEMKNEDLLNISSPLRTSIKINYDMKSLVKSEFVYDMDPELVDKDLTDEEYLNITRRRAESKLIKMKIIYKLNQEIAELTTSEKQYLKRWLNDVRSSEDRNILNLRDSLLPDHPTKLKLNDIDAKNYYALNSITKVQLDRDMHGQYSLNDLVLELSHFLDEEVVNKIETEIYSDRLRNEWGISKDFRVIETRNKEISLVLNELEEVAFRTSGQFNDRDLENIKKMLSVKRNKDLFDKSYYETDMSSYKGFMEGINTYDQRIQLLERWIVRKEQEYKDRVTLLPENLRHSDQELFTKYDKPLKAARERLVAQLLVADEYGNPINKNYKDLTSRELNVISENLAVRLYLFNYEYPNFLPQAVKAVMEHPNLLRSDQDLLDTYCKMFELDWRGDKTLENRSELLFQNPIYLDGLNVKSYGEISSEKVQDKMRRACANYVEPTAEKLMNFNF